jgi:hypothetical protein
VVVGRWLHYQGLLGVKSPRVPAEGQTIPEVPPSAHVQMSDQSGIRTIATESEELEQLEQAKRDTASASNYDDRAAVANMVPALSQVVTFLGGGTIATHGGMLAGAVFSAYASSYRYDASEASFMATKAGKQAAYALRGHEHTLQSNQAAREIAQIDKQIVASEIRVEMAKKEVSNHKQRLANAREVEAELRDKYTNQELYGWMLGQLSTVYFQTYQMAYDLARRAERSFQRELGLADSSFIQFGYWDSLKKGLLAGERLHHDLTRMEVAYLEKNKRDLEMTKHVSLSQLDPLTLIALRQTRSCVVKLPEALFDIDYPGHYARRIKSVGITIPCVTGPYVGVSCTLSLLESSVRHSNNLLGGKTYARGEEDPRFTDTLGPIESIVTSSGQNDTGLFEPNLRDERYLPFEGAGVIGTWRIDLPAAFPQFDYDTISDVVLHVRYTAKAGGGLLAQQATNELQTALNELIQTEGQAGLVDCNN